MCNRNIFIQRCKVSCCNRAVMLLHKNRGSVRQKREVKRGVGERKKERKKERKRDIGKSAGSSAPHPWPRGWTAVEKPTRASTVSSLDRNRCSESSCTAGSNFCNLFAVLSNVLRLLSKCARPRRCFCVLWRSCCSYSKQYNWTANCIRVDHFA